MGDLHRQAGFANSAGTGQGDQPDGAPHDPVCEVACIQFPANQPAGEVGKIHERFVKLTRSFVRNSVENSSQLWPRSGNE